MTSSKFRAVLLCLVPALAVGAPQLVQAVQQDTEARQEEPAVRVHFLEIVTPDVDATCDAFEELHGVPFGEPIAAFGNARTAKLVGGGRVSVRAPMHSAEEPVVRPYVLVDDIAAAVELVEAAGAMIMHPPLEIPGQGTFALYLHGGIQHGLWEL